MRTGRESPVLQDTLLHRETFIVTPTQVGRCSESFSDSVALLAASVATGTYRQFPGQDFHLQETRLLSAAHIRTRVSASRIVIRTVAMRTYGTVATVVATMPSSSSGLSLKWSKVFPSSLKARSLHSPRS
jgi:hypothetical protein